VTSSCLCVLRVLAAHPNDDTVPAIALTSGLPMAEVETSLQDLRSQRLARRWESHWQLTSAGLVAATA
jgi:DNA-binding IclR family transcriptional regulator